MDLDGYIIDELIEKEIRKLNVDASVLRRPFGTLSMGERTKVMIAALFLKKNNFLLIDEPTNHLDADGRQCMAQYLRSKKGFILVSHDRYFLDTTIDHVLSINRCNIEVQHGNFTSWQENKNRQDQFEIDQNHKLVKDIVRLEESSKRTAGWSDKVEKTKYNTPVAGLRPDRGYIGHKSAKMMKRAKAIEARREKSVNEKKKLLKNIERSDRLKIHAEEYFRDTLINVDDLTVAYGGRIVLNGLSFTVNSGDRVALRGINGSGKSTVLKLIMGESIIYTGNIKIGSGLTISYVPQDTSFLRGTLRQYANSEGIDESLFRAILDKLNFKISDECADMQTMSGGQKKKVLIASSLSKKANLYVWDEPLNFVDVLSRIQIEKLIAEYEPTMIFVEHDYVFNENVATKVIELS